ncbi:UNVERIFIED_CONTAM: hypothetical protein FKN15_065997, partial [Acipenser sinensis]
PKKKKEKLQVKAIKTGTDTEYGVLNVQVSGHDMTIVEHYSQYVHNLCNRLKIKVDESYALPTKCTEVMLLQEQGTKMFADAVLSTHERIVQLSGLSSTLAPVFVEVLLRNQPEGVQLSIKEKSVHISCPYANAASKFLSPYTSFPGIHDKSVRAASVAVCCRVQPIYKAGEVEKILILKLCNLYYTSVFPVSIVTAQGTVKNAFRLRYFYTGILDTAVVERGRNVLSCSRDGTARLWDCGKSVCLAVVADCGAPINGCSVGVADNTINQGSPEEPSSDREVGTEDKLLLLAREDKKLQAVGLQSRQPIFLFEGSDAFNCCTFLSSIYVLAGTQDGNIYKLDTRNAK